MIAAFFDALRPRQWTKNLLVFAGILFSQQFTNIDLLLRAAAGFVAFSLLAGSVYLLNDIKDAPLDRLHPRKRLRPIPSGRLSPTAALIGVIPVLAIAGMVAWSLGRGFSMALVVYLLINLAYSFALKNQVLIDVFIIATGFVLRAIAGVELLRPVSPSTSISPWLLVCTFFGALFLALAKRRREITNAGDSASGQRQVLAHYTAEFLDGTLLITAAASIMGYALYTIWPATVSKFGTEAMLYTVPIVAYGVFRYLFLVKISEATEDPSLVLVTDRALGGCVVLYLIAVVMILYHPW
jgi:4-hydroxybenzoate polyprenyltransferase